MTLDTTTPTEPQTTAPVTSAAFDELRDLMAAWADKHATVVMFGATAAVRVSDGIALASLRQLRTDRLGGDAQLASAVVHGFLADQMMSGSRLAAALGQAVMPDPADIVADGAEPEYVPPASQEPTDAPATTPGDPGVPV